jgi:hypothetical protein
MPRVLDALTSRILDFLNYLTSESPMTKLKLKLRKYLLDNSNNSKLELQEIEKTAIKNLDFDLLPASKKDMFDISINYKKHIPFYRVSY